MGYFRDLLEASKPFTTADVEINGKKYKLVRTTHVAEPRGNSIIPRDGNMSKSKYEKLLNLGLSKIDINKQFVISWTGGNGKSNAFTAKVEHSKIKIITAYMNETSKESSLFKLITNRISVII